MPTGLLVDDRGTNHSRRDCDMPTGLLVDDRGTNHSRRDCDMPTGLLVDDRGTNHRINILGHSQLKCSKMTFLCRTPILVV